MMRRLWAVFLVSTLLGDVITLNENPIDFIYPTLNEVRRSIYVQLTVASPTITLQIFPPERTAQDTALIAASNVADIIVPSVSVTKTLKQIAADKVLTLDAIIGAKPNPSAVGGYLLLLQLQTIVFNYNITDANFFLFQGIPLQNPTVTPVTADLVYQNIRLTGGLPKQWLAFVDGMFISDAWTSTAWETVDNSFGTSKPTTKHLTISIPYDKLASLADGTYWLTIYGEMTPYTPPTISNQVTILFNLIQPQLIYRNQLISEIDTLLADKTSLNAFPPTEIAALSVNKKILQTQVKEINKDVNAYLTTLAEDPAATANDQQLILQTQIAITALASLET